MTAPRYSRIMISPDLLKEVFSISGKEVKGLEKNINVIRYTDSRGQQSQVSYQLHTNVTADYIGSGLPISTDEFMEAFEQAIRWTRHEFKI